MKDVKELVRRLRKQSNCVYLAATESVANDLSKSLRDAADALEALSADAERLDWLETMVVNVRVPLRYGSRNLFWVNPDDEEDCEPGPSDIRAAIDEAKK